MPFGCAVQRVDPAAPDRAAKQTGDSATAPDAYGKLVALSKPVGPARPELTEADAAMRELIELFSDPKIRSTASFRCCTDGPTEFDILFESIVD